MGMGESESAESYLTTIHIPVIVEVMHQLFFMEMRMIPICSI
jgi:hypothetical protein